MGPFRLLYQFLNLLFSGLEHTDSLASNYPASALISLESQIYIAIKSMRLWLILFMILAALISPLLRSSIKSPTGLRTAIAPIFNKTIYNIQPLRAAPVSTSTSLKQYQPTMATADATQPSSASEPEALASKLAETSNTEPSLPKLSAEDFRVYNRLAVMMDAYHNHFRHTWNMLYQACSSSTRPTGTSIRSFLSHGLRLCQSLTIHHTIEEQHVFPELAERMPIFEPMKR